MLIDTHAHLYDSSIEATQTEVLKRAADTGVGCVLLPNIDLESIDPMLKLSKVHPHCIPMMGLHPCYVKEDWVVVLESIRKHLFENTGLYCGVGEIGIDLHWDQSFKTQQIAVFETQLEWAQSLSLPAALHVRKSFNEVFASMKQKAPRELNGVFHCFSGGAQERDYILKNHPEFYFGIGGVITYKNTDLKTVVSQIPLDRLVLETDSPYLAPEPFRGKGNEPQYLSYILAALAKCLSKTEEAVADLTTENAKRLFQLEKWGI